MPLSVADKEWVARLSVRGQYVQDGIIEDLVPRPNPKMRRKMGGRIGIVAGVVGGKVYQYVIPNQKWNSKAAMGFYRGLRAFRKRHFPQQRKSNLVEDNDPSQKTQEAEKLKGQLGFTPIGLPPRSPDLSPLDFSVWGEVLRRMRLQEEGMKVKKESKKQFAARLRKTISGLGKDFLQRTMRSMKTRLKKCHLAGGKRFQE